MGVPVVIVASGGLPVTEAANGRGLPVSIAANGFGIPITVVASGGLPVVGTGPVLQLSGAAFAAGAAQGTAIGTLAVVGGSGTYTFTLTDSHSNAVQVAAANLQVGSSSSGAGSFSITVHADNGAGSTVDATFPITVTSSAFIPSLDFSDARNSQYLMIGVI